MGRLFFGMCFSLLWASAFIAGKYTLLSLPPVDVLALRFFLAAALTALLGLLLRRPANAWRDRRLWRDAAVLGGLNYALYLGLSYTGLQTVSPEMVVLLVSTTPFVTTLAESCLGRRWSWQPWPAIVLGFAGVYLVLSARLSAPVWAPGVMWALAGMLALSAGTLFYQYRACQHPPLVLAGLQNLFGGLWLLPLSTPAAWAAAWREPVFVAALLYQALAVSLLAMLMWFQLLRWFGSGHAAAFHLLNPVFATVLAWLFFRIPLGGADVAGTLLVVLALTLLQWQRQRPSGRSS